MIELPVTGRVVGWGGPGRYFYLPLDEDSAAVLDDVKHAITYGWGVLPTRARLGEVEFTTSLFPRDGSYLVPLKDAVRKPAGIGVGDEVTVTLHFDAR